MTTGISRGPAPTNERPPRPVDDGPHLWNRHLDALKAAEVRGKTFAFRDPHRGTDYLPVGQWLLAMEHCQAGHTFQTFGDPCYCGSDNCDYCARCGVEDHD